MVTSAWSMPFHWTCRVSEQYSDTTNNRTLVHEDADNRLYHGIKGWVHWIWQLKNGAWSSVPTCARWDLTYITVRNIRQLATTSCIFGCCFLFLLWSNSQQDFCTIGKQQDHDGCTPEMHKSRTNVSIFQLSDSANFSGITINWCIGHMEALWPPSLEPAWTVFEYCSRLSSVDTTLTFGYLFID